MNTKGIFSTGLLALLLWTVPLYAEDDFSPGQGACRKEVQELCKGIKPGQGRLRACLEENKAKLSPACQKRFEAGQGRGREGKEPLQQACKADFQKLCKGSKVRPHQCLLENKDKLSEECRKHLEAMKPKK
ncbi:MAG: hypothetical protein HS115_13075 [Spirochaetales bacterium]|nr:hypothetical protein [Spirochaetales bacterium]